VRSGVQRIHLSTSAFDAESHERLFRTKNYGRLLDGVKRLLETRNRLHAPLKVVFEFRSDMSLAEVLNRPDFREEIGPLMRRDEWRSVQARIVGYNDWGGMIRRADLTGKMSFGLPPRNKRRPCV